MRPYAHKKFSLAQLVSMMLRGLAKLFNLWPWLLIALWFFSPTTLYMRWQYHYQDYGRERVYQSCQYLGPSGFINYMHGDTCPFIAVVKRRH